MKPPVVIGAVPGSGTRVVARIVQCAGVFIGTNRTGAEDAVEFWEFYDRWINRYLMREKIPLAAEEVSFMRDDFDRCVKRHRMVVPIEDAPWGWKNPRSLLLLAFLHEQFPEMRFIHVVRDGRDMAFSENQYDVKRHGAAVLQGRLQDAPQPVRAAAIWAVSNVNTHDYGKRHMAQTYLRLNFETLCERPKDSVQLILDFLANSTADAAKIAEELIVSPTTMGRWRRIGDEKIMQAIQQHAGEALRTFGYC